MTNCYRSDLDNVLVKNAAVAIRHSSFEKFVISTSLLYTSYNPL